VSWVARKLSMSDDVDHNQVIKEYFQKKEMKLLEEQEIKKFWEEYGDEYYTGGE